MMTPNRPRRDPYVLLLAALTWGERQVLYASLNSGWSKQLYAVRDDEALRKETSQLLDDILHAEDNAAVYREHASATCRTCGASGATVELEKITARPVGGAAARTEWLCADHAACTTRRFPAIAEVLGATGSAA